LSDVRAFGARGDGTTDDTDAVLRALEEGDGVLSFPRGDYLLTRPVEIDLDRFGRVGIEGAVGTGKVVMGGPGPAFHLKGSHGRSADPKHFDPGVWAGERLPTVLNLEIEGRHPEADGFLVEGTMQSTFEGVLLRKLRDGIRIHDRARNVLISHCHIYDNSGRGIALDHVNLHQVIVTGSHISYCKRGGIKVEGSQIRNLQVTGNDIEYNFDENAECSADVWIDSRDEAATVREGTIVSNTIQASHSPGGANVLMVGHDSANNQAGQFTISDNLIGTQENNIHLVNCRGVVLNGNVVYGARDRNLLVQGTKNVILAGNSFDHNPDYNKGELCTGLKFEDSEDCTLSGTNIQDAETEDAAEGRRAIVEFHRCRRVNLSGCQILNGSPVGILLEDVSDASITGCTVLEDRDEKSMRASVVWAGTGTGNLMANNRLCKGVREAVSVGEDVDVNMNSNVVL
jgi:hypothetical protein